MRLSKKEIEAIKRSFNEVFKRGEIYLFGSRIDDSKKGGDIDLYLIVENKSLKNKLKFLAKIKRILGERKINVIFNIYKNRLIEKEAKKWGIKL